MRDLISVIVPVYNVAPFLPQCLDSILTQDYRALEVLLIDDGSQDGSGAVCDEYARRDSRVRVLHQKNAGAGAAKNAGLRAAAGEYLSFVDSDDFLEPGAYSSMLQLMKEAQADVAHCAFRDVYRDRTEDQISGQGRKILDAQTYLRGFLNDWTCPLLWNKLYRRQLYHGVFFPEGRKIDDEFFTYRAFLKECRVVRDDRIVYNYRKRTSSAMGDYNAAGRRLMDALDAIVQRREETLPVYPQLRKALDENYLDAVWYLSGNFGCTEDMIRMLKGHLKDYLRTPGNTFPPRHLWAKLAGLFFADPKKRAAACEAVRRTLDQSDYF